MFRAVPLPIIRSFPLHIRHWYMSSNLHDIYQYRMYSGKLLTMGRGTARNMQSFLTKINLEKFSTSVGFIKKKFVTMHGHMNVKLHFVFTRQTPIHKIVSFRETMDLFVQNVEAHLQSPGSQRRPCQQTTTVFFIFRFADGCQTLYGRDLATDLIIIVMATAK